MYNFKTQQTCIKCGSSEYTPFVSPGGQGLRCNICNHKKIICKAQNYRHKTPFKQRMAAEWTDQKKRSTF